MLKIGEFSKLAKMTVKTLRYYDEIGLLNPVFIDENGYRYYQISQLNVLLKIASLRKLDMSLVDIKKIINNNDMLAILFNHQKSLENDFHKKQHQISLIKNYIEKAKKGDFMENYKIKEITVPESIVYYKHGIINSMAELTNFVFCAGTECAKNNPNLKCKGYCYITYIAKEYKEKEIELEYVEAVENYGNESENIKFRKDPEIKVASVSHKGRYEDLSQAYAFALNYVKDKHYEICGPIREVYIHGCWDKTNEDDYLTEIQIPIK